MSQGTSIALFLLGDPIAAILANDLETFKEWLCGDIKDMRRPAVEELMIVWMNPLLNEEELDRIVTWHLGVSLWSLRRGIKMAA